MGRSIVAFTEPVLEFLGELTLHLPGVLSKGLGCLGRHVGRRVLFLCRHVAGGREEGRSDGSFGLGGGRGGASLSDDVVGVVVALELVPFPVDPGGLPDRPGVVKVAGVEALDAAGGEGLEGAFLALPCDRSGSAPSE